MKISVDDLLRGCHAFAEHESRDAMYKIARELVDERWGDTAATADALGVLLLTWNQAAYRYGRFDFARLQAFLEKNASDLAEFRTMRLEDVQMHDASRVRRLFDALLDSLATATGARSPVGAGKALHLLAPRMFPLWDNKIARVYGCRLYGAPGSAQKYVRFTQKIKEILESLAEQRSLNELVEELNAQARFQKPILKYVDEYNYARYTYGWIS